jgi:hypothetical protein
MTWKIWGKIMIENSLGKLLFKKWWDDHPELVELAKAQTPAGKIAHNAMVEMTMRRPNPGMYISPLVDGTACTVEPLERCTEKLDRLAKYTADAKQALQALCKSIRATICKTRFTGRSKPAKRAMAKLAARRCR